jgi:hypothetical protein
MTFWPWGYLVKFGNVVEETDKLRYYSDSLTEAEQHEIRP